MQITPLPTSLPQTQTHPAQDVTQVMPQVQALAAAPISANAVAPTPKSEKGEETKRKKEREGQEDSAEKDPDDETALEAEKRGENLNISV